MINADPFATQVVTTDDVRAAALPNAYRVSTSDTFDRRFRDAVRRTIAELEKIDASCRPAKPLFYPLNRGSFQVP